MGYGNHAWSHNLLDFVFQLKTREKLHVIFTPLTIPLKKKYFLISSTYLIVMNLKHIKSL